MGTRQGSFHPKHGGQQAPSRLQSSLTDRTTVVATAVSAPEVTKAVGTQRKLLSNTPALAAQR